MLLDVISAQRQTNEDSFYRLLVPNIFGFGDYQQISPSMLWDRDRTIIGGNKSNAFNNQIQLMVYNHLQNTGFVREVGTGTNQTDAVNHPRTYLHIPPSGSIYCGQTNTHNAPIDIWKASNAYNLRQEFNLFGQVLGDNAYPQMFYDVVNGNAGFLVRDFSGGGNSHVLATQISDGGIEGTFTKQLITLNTEEADPTNPVWHYNKQPLMYGTNKVHYMVIGLRDQNDSKYFAFALLKTTDYINYSNYDGSFTKDVTASRITSAELYANCLINGSEDRSVNQGLINCIVINDSFYAVYQDVNDDSWNMMQIKNGFRTDITIPFQDIYIFGIHTPYLYYNGQNIVLSTVNFKGNDVYNKEIWSVTTTMDSFRQKLINEDIEGIAEPMKLPDNLDKVNGEYAIVWGNVSQSRVDLRLTTDKFYH